MKTFKTLLIISLLTVTTLATVAKEKNEVPTLKAANFEELKSSITEFFKDDFSRYNNYFYQHGINKFDETVEIVFRVMPNNKMYIFRIDCNDCSGVEYVKTMLKNVTFDVDEELLNRNFGLKIKLNYRT
jgi:hypothetical protein